MLTTAINWLNTACRWIASGLLAAILAILLVQTGMRATGFSGFPWVNELATFMVVWAVSLGAAAAFWDGAHLGVDSLVTRLGRARRPVMLFAQIVTVLFLCVLAFYGWSMTRSGMNTTSPALQIPMGFVYMAIPVGGAVSLANILTIVATGRDTRTQSESEIDDEIALVIDPIARPDDPQSDPPRGTEDNNGNTRTTGEDDPT